MTDLLLTPSNPVSSYYDLSALTPQGKKFLFEFYRFRQYIQTGRDMRNFKEAVAGQGLTYKCDWTLALEAKDTVR